LRTWAWSCGAETGYPRTVAKKTGSTEFSGMSLHAAALPSLLEFRGLANTKTTPHDYQQTTGTVTVSTLMASAKPTFMVVRHGFRRQH